MHKPTNPIPAKTAALAGSGTALTMRIGENPELPGSKVEPMEPSRTACASAEKEEYEIGVPEPVKVTVASGVPKPPNIAMPPNAGSITS